MPAGILSGLMVVLGQPDARAALSKRAATAAQKASETAAQTGQLLASGIHQATRSAGQAAAGVAQAVKPLPTALTTGIGSVLSTGTLAVKTAAQQENHMMKTTKADTTEAAVRKTLQGVQETSRLTEVQAAVQKDMEYQLNHRLGLFKQELDHQLLQQDVLLASFGEQLGRLSRPMRPVQPQAKRKGFPWFLVLLGGAGVLLWRQPQLRQKATDLFGQLGPKARQTVEKAQEAVRQRAGQGQQDQGETDSPSTMPGEAAANFVVEDDLAQRDQTVVTAVDPTPLTQTPGSALGMDGGRPGTAPSVSGVQGNAPLGSDPSNLASSTGERQPNRTSGSANTTRRR
ncbi:hypothetical protein ACFFLM_05230 [Deinococcus oregonensis]|uniref:Uncharacterized protein n=1 Tax=Deinococcus oregonensis TaxID=1805970 RepID=A0ABV6AV47_9DEIO